MADYQKILHRTRSILEGFAKTRMPVQAEEIREDTEIAKDLGLDSLQVMEVVSEIEDAFDITFPVNELFEIRTVRDLVLRIQHILEET
ncbi:MAG: acyl carrier protein [Deltaproteobacteria bacterium]